MLGQQQSQTPPRSGRSIHDIKQYKEYQPFEQEKCNRSFDLVKLKSLKFDNVKSVIFTKL